MVHAQSLELVDCLLQSGCGLKCQIGILELSLEVGFLLGFG